MKTGPAICLSPPRHAGPLLSAAMLLLFLPRIFAAETSPVASVQELLRTQQVYHGELTGDYDAETRSAVRQFQIREGLPVTEKIDVTTLRALARAEPPARAAAESGDEIQSARERARTKIEEDQAFLARIEAAEQAVREKPDGSPPIVEKSPAPPSPARPPSLQAAPAAVAVVPAAAPVRPSPAEARQFVREYVSAAGESEPGREISFYAASVNYFDEGRLSHAAIARDQRAYYRRWPSRRFSLLGEPEVIRTTADGATVRFRIRYELHRGDETARGRTENIMKIRRIGDGLRIVGIDERKLD